MLKRMFVPGSEEIKGYRKLRSKKLRYLYRGADKSLARLGRKQATATEDFEFHVSYL